MGIAGSMTDLISTFGASDPDPAPATPAVPAAPPVAPVAPVTPAPAAPAAPAAPSAEPPADPTPEELFSKKSGANAAFAQMRTENTAYKRTLGRLAGMLGVADTSDPERVIEALTTRLTEYEASTKNIPVELLQRLEQAEQATARYQNDQLKVQATLGFENIKNTYKLSPAELTEFAQQLLAAGKNPFEEPVNLVEQYKLLNFDKLMAAQADAAAKDGYNRGAAAATQSTTPSKVQTPAAPPAAAKIGAVEFEQLVRGHK